MKNLISTLIICTILSVGTSSVFAQESKADKKKAKQEKKLEKEKKKEQKNLMSIETLQFTFNPTTVEPEFGMVHDIVSLAPFMTVDKDNFIAELPYLGAFYIQPTSALDVPIRLTSNHFLYSVKTDDNITFNVIIIPEDTVSLLNKGMKFEFTLNKENGSAKLDISSDNRDNITYTGYFNN